MTRTKKPGTYDGKIEDGLEVILREIPTGLEIARITVTHGLAPRVHEIVELTVQNYEKERRRRGMKVVKD